MKLQKYRPKIILNNITKKYHVLILIMYPFISLRKTSTKGVYLLTKKIKIYENKNFNHESKT